VSAVPRTRAFPRAYIHCVNAARTVLLYAVAGVIGILLGLATAQATDTCTGSCAGARPLLAVWQSGLIGLACAVVVLIACALLDEEFIPVTRQWLRAARRRRSGDGSKRQAS
jgi:ABC-type antimicrobial peptide transport system permease subunit